MILLLRMLMSCVVLIAAIIVVSVDAQIDNNNKQGSPPVQPLNIGFMLHYDNVKKPQAILDRIVAKMDTRISSAANDILVNITTHVLKMSDNSITNVLSLCEHFIQPERPIHALVVSHPPDKPREPPEALSYACEFYKIPIISVSTQDPVYSEKALHSTFLRTVSPDTEQSRVWADLLHDPMFRYSRVVLVYPDNYSGQQLYERVVESFERVFINISRRVNYAPGLSKSQAETLLRALNTPLRVFLFYGSQDDAGVIFSAALNVGMLNKGYFWLVSQSAASVAPVGSVFVQLKSSSDVEWHLERAVRSIYGGLLNFLKKQNRIKPFRKLQPLATCNSKGWTDGNAFYSRIRDQSMDQIIQYNMNGDPSYGEYDIFVKQSSVFYQQIGTWKQGTGGKDSQIYVNEKLIQSDNTISWIGNSRKLPEGVTIEGNLRIVTVEDRPFVFVIEMPPGPPKSSCNNATFAVCKYYNPEKDVYVDKCCYGYCIQLLQSVSSALNFSYTLHLQREGKFGHYKIRSSGNPGGSASVDSSTSTGGGKSERVWNGAIGDLVRGEYDAAFASMTIDHDRSNVVDFTNPFKPQGLSIAVKKQKPNDSFSSFVQPFHYSLWILIFISVHIVAFILYILDRFSPFARSRGQHKQQQQDSKSIQGSMSSLYPDEDEGDEALNLSSALWFAYGVLLNSGIGGTPRSFAARVLGMVWAGFAMIIVASYTANLAAYLVLERPESEITGINDARMRNPSDTYPYGTVSDSAVENYFRRKVEMTNMYHFMQNYSHPTQNEALHALKEGKIEAFIWDSAQLDYETSLDCDLMMVGDTFQKSGLAVALQKDSVWTEKISLEILKMRETGEMEQMDRDWIFVNSCAMSDNKPTTLGINSMAGIFLTVAVGVILGGVCMVMERVYYRHFDGSVVGLGGSGLWASEQQQQVARSAFDKWKIHTEETPGFSTDFMSSHGKSVECDSVCHAQFSPGAAPYRQPQAQLLLPKHRANSSSLPNNHVMSTHNNPNNWFHEGPSSSSSSSTLKHNHTNNPPHPPNPYTPQSSGLGGVGGGSAGSPNSDTPRSSQTGGVAGGFSGPPIPPPKTSSLDRNQGNRVVQFKSNLDHNASSASYVDV
ncbi:glutamate receptor ionotropic, NMDA 1-like isoform X2 [Convolutriloba macropyga]|uniref:glutamate receptor ionotropic, NMDA 1-like isoform X2 n=1 Tax=Convolutriloba macropyga TaxID=536237 RepID=UPI003F5203F7